MYIFIILFSLTAAFADTTINLTQEEEGAKLSISVSGDFPVYTARLTAGKKHVPDAWQYVSLITVDTCKGHDRFPRSLENKQQHNNTTYFYYEITFKCENRDGSDYEEMVKARCEKPATKNYQQICDDLEKKYGKDFISCKSGKCKDPFHWD